MTSSGDMPPAPTEPALSSTPGPYRVSMVCTGNICRSPMAESVLAHALAVEGLADAVAVSSAGTHSYHVGEDADPRALRTLARHGYDLDHRASRIVEADLAELDLVLTMDAGHFAHVTKMVALSGARTLVRPIRAFDPQLREREVTDASLDVPDPYYGAEDGFAEVLAMLERTMPALVEFLRQQVGRS